MNPPYRNHKIFVNDHVQGRNANIAASMLKKAELTSSKVSDKNELSPFSGFSYPTNENSLATSYIIIHLYRQVS